MRSHKFRYSFDKWMKLKKWDPYLGYKKGYRYSNILPSGYYENQAWGALQKCWVGYWIARDKGEDFKEIMYANRIQNLQKEIGLEVSDFECLENLDDEEIKIIEESIEK